MKQGIPKSIMKLNPMIFVQDAAQRAKMKREEKQQEIAKLELQKETLKHFKEKVAQEMIVIDAPRTRAQENNEKAAFMAHSNIKNNPLLQYNDSHLTMTMQPNKFNVNGWAFKQLSDCKFRSNFMEENLNGRYCNRTLSSKKDVETYKPNKIFSSMYTKAFYNMDNIKFTREPKVTDLNNSRNLVGQSANITTLSRIGTSKGREEDLDRQSTISHVLNSRQERRAIDLLTKSGALSKTKEDVNFPKNDYSPDFVTSLNFNFNTNDIFGPRAKKATALSLLKSTSANNEGELKDAISSMQQQFDNRRGTLREQSKQKLETAVCSQDRTKGFMSTQNLDEEFKLRRQLNNDILKNQYSFWAGMYVKRQSAKNSDLAFGSGRNTMHLGSIRNITDISDIPVVPFGDPRSLTQCLNFSRKQRPYLPEQECSKGGGVKLIGPPNKRDRPQKLKIRQLMSKQKAEALLPKSKKII